MAFQTKHKSKRGGFRRGKEAQNFENKVSHNRPKSEYRQKQKDQLTEEDVGILEYISKLEGYPAMIKARFSDFHEINLEGKMAKLTDKTTPRSFAMQQKKYSYNDIIKSPLEMIPQEIWDALKNLVKNTGGEPVLLEACNLSRNNKKRIYACVKSYFGEEIIASTIRKDEKSVLEFRKYKKREKDSRVHTPDDTTEFVHFIAYMEMMDTMEACYRIAQALSIFPTQITYAGEKDRRAKTSQWFCIRKYEPSKILEKTRHIRNLHIGNFEFKEKCLKMGELKGNRFRIGLRNVKADDELITKSMEHVKENGFINYYGLQRFGNDKEAPTFSIGIQLLLGQWQEAVDLILKVKAGDNPSMGVTKAKKLYVETRDAVAALKLWDKKGNSFEKKLLKGLKNHENDLVAALEYVSMDGPNVNWKFLRLLKQDPDLEDSNMIEIGSCGLHVVHGSLQTGHNKVHWKVNQFLTGLYWLFKDSPVRRGEFTRITSCDKFPKKFCKTRWVESASTASRALEILDSVHTYITDKSVKLPTNISISGVKTGLEDKLIKCKLAFFATIAEILEPFCRKYQHSKPMAPFLYKDLERVVRNLAGRFLKEEKMEDNLSQIMKLDLKMKTNLKHVMNTDIGFSTRRYLSTAVTTEKEKLLFYADCQNFLISVTQKILERCCLKYKIVKGMSALNPQLILSNGKEAIIRFKLLLEELHVLGKIDDPIAENSQQQYQEFVRNEAILNELKKFNEELNLADLYVKLLVGNIDYMDLWSVVKLILIVSHGNATVESGFSINKELLVETLHENSVITQRLVYDAIKNAGGSVNVEIDEKLRRYTKRSSSNYKEALNAKKKETTEEQLLRKRKECAIADIKILERKKRTLMECTDFEKAEIDRDLIKLREKLNQK